MHLIDAFSVVIDGIAVVSASSASVIGAFVYVKDERSALRVWPVVRRVSLVVGCL
jgi:hypothetical protein